MSRNLYKLIEKIEKRLGNIERRVSVVENTLDHMDTLRRIWTYPDGPNDYTWQSPWTATFMKSEPKSKKKKVDPEFEEIEKFMDDFFGKEN